jgi:plastocyanin
MTRLTSWALAALVMAGVMLATVTHHLPARTAQAADGEVAIRLFAFRPTPLTVEPGTTVTWINGDDITHTVTSGTPAGKDGRFEARLAGKQASFHRTFRETGIYPYFCERHPNMIGEVFVR